MGIYSGIDLGTSWVLTSVLSCVFSSGFLNATWVLCECQSKCQHYFFLKYFSPLLPSLFYRHFFTVTFEISTVLFRSTMLSIQLRSLFLNLGVIMGLILSVILGVLNLFYVSLFASFFISFFVSFFVSHSLFSCSARILVILCWLHIIMTYNIYESYVVPS